MPMFDEHKELFDELDRLMKAIHKLKRARIKEIMGDKGERFSKRVVAAVRVWRSPPPEWIDQLGTEFDQWKISAETAPGIGMNSSAESQIDSSELFCQTAK